MLINNWYLGAYGTLTHKRFYQYHFFSWWCIKPSSAVIFTDPKTPTINILPGWAGIYVQFGLTSSLFSSITSSRLIILGLFYYIAIFNFFTFMYYLFACSMCMCFNRINWSYPFNIISNQCNLNNFFASKSFCDFNIDLLFSIYWSFIDPHHVYCFSSWFVLFLSWIAFKQCL